MNLEKYIEDQILWSKKVFGEDNTRCEGICKHIENELEEVRDKPNDIVEWCDIIILALDGAWRQGYSPNDICKALCDKQRININRKWNVGTDSEPVFHVKEK